MDDTKVVGKAVIGELMEDLTLLFDNKYGVRYGYKKKVKMAIYRN